MIYFLPSSTNTISRVYIGIYGVQSPPKFNFRILLVFLALVVVVLQFAFTSAIQHSSFQFLYSNCRFDIVCFTIQHCNLKYSTSKFTQFNIQLSKMHVFDIQHSQCGLRKVSKFSLSRGQQRQVTLPWTVAFTT